MRQTVFCNPEYDFVQILSIQLTTCLHVFMCRNSIIDSTKGADHGKRVVVPLPFHVFIFRNTLSQQPANHLLYSCATTRAQKKKAQWWACIGLKAINACQVVLFCLCLEATPQVVF
jgi:hypothetical protein